MKVFTLEGVNLYRKCFFRLNFSWNYTLSLKIPLSNYEDCERDRTCVTIRDGKVNMDALLFCRSGRGHSLSLCMDKNNSENDGIDEITHFPGTEHADFLVCIPT